MFGENLTLIFSLYHDRPWKDELDQVLSEHVLNYEQEWTEHTKKKDHLAWYEFTPFEIGCDEQAGKRTM